MPRTHWTALIRGDRDWGTEAKMHEAELKGLANLFKLRLTKGTRSLEETGLEWRLPKDRLENALKFPIFLAFTYSLPCTCWPLCALISMWHSKQDRSSLSAASLVSSASLCAAARFRSCMASLKDLPCFS